MQCQMVASRQNLDLCCSETSGTAHMSQAFTGCVSGLLCCRGCRRCCHDAALLLPSGVAGWWALRRGGNSCQRRLPCAAVRSGSTTLLAIPPRLCDCAHAGATPCMSAQQCRGQPAANINRFAPMERQPLRGRHSP